MAVLDSVQFEQLVSEVKEQILAQSQGVGEVAKVDSLAGIYSLPALKGRNVVEAPIELLSKPAEDAALRADETVREKIEDVDEAVRQAIGNVDSAIADAEDTATHPTYIGDDNYVYVWDKSTKTYNKTTIYTRGEGFSISKTYASIEDMEADKEHGLKEGDFVLINTNDVENPDNAKIYVVDSEGGFTFLVDMSGAIGFTGKTPQFEIGEVTAGENRSDVSATVTANGTDSDGNPKYLLNLKVPSIAFSDLTDDDIAVLQSPAKEMIEQLQETDKTVKENEASRIEAEESRVSAEALRVEEETARAEAEAVRVESEVERIDSENLRKASEEGRLGNEEVRQENEAQRTASENIRVSNENGRVIAESERVSNEGDRIASENERKGSESVRVSNEDSRIASELERKANESTRITNEDTRKDNESERMENERIRQANESERVDEEEARKAEYALLKEDILEATANANDAASESRNTPVIKDGTWWIWDSKQDEYVDTGTPATSRSPKIENGTWWVWDDTTGVYADTGQSVNSTYQLTKDKIEGVFTGNVVSHWHDRYVDKEEGKRLSTEDFTTEEKTKLAGLENFDPTEVNESIKALEESMPTKVGDLVNDVNYVTSYELEVTNNSIKAVEDSIPTKVSELENDSEYVTSSQLSDVSDNVKALEEAMPSKVSDLTNDSGYVTSTELSSKKYATEDSLKQGLDTKQDLNVYVRNVSAYDWVLDSTYKGFKYRCDITVADVTEDTFAEVIFSVEQATGGDYAPVCETKDGIVSIWSSANEPIVVPTIVISR